MVSFQPYLSGIMITTMKAGDVTIVARTSSACGTAPLHITQFTADDWNAGNARYNNNGALNICLDGGQPFDAGDFDGNLSGIDASAIRETVATARTSLRTSSTPSSACRRQLARTATAP